jgi:glycosyltransferase involved in cell wall biosynthesis
VAIKIDRSVKRMNIAIDVLAILGPHSKNRGIGNYTTSQLKEMFKQDTKNRYFLINFYENTSLKPILEYSSNVSEHYFYLGKNDFLGKEPQYNCILSEIVDNFITENQIEVFYFTSLFDEAMYYDMKWFSHITTVVTLYDIIPYIFQDKYLPPNSEIRKHYLKQISELKKADCLLAISESAKNDAVNYLNIPKEKVEVIYAGVDEVFQNVIINSIEKKELLKRYGITDEFIMCTGGDDERKNIEGLIRAYSQLPKELINRFQLVVVCKINETSELRYTDISKKNGVAGRVLFTNFVPIDDLVLLYNCAYMVAFPSIYEGFGLPVVEAMACGTPVLTSNNSSLGEISLGAAILVDPFNTKDITRGLNELLTTTEINKLVQLGYEKVEKFSWVNVSTDTINIINSFDIETEINKEKRNRIAFFTPLPPLKSGISDYSVDIMNELVNYFDIDVFIDSGYRKECNLNKNVNVYNHTEFENFKDYYTCIIYQMGNSEFHVYMLEYISKYPGIIVLHDHNLHGLLHYTSIKKSNVQMYKDFLHEDYDIETVEKYIARIKNGQAHIDVFGIELNNAVIKHANKIIVHSDYSKRKLLNKNIGFNVKRIYSYAKTDVRFDKDLSRTQLNIDKEKFISAAFGHIHETKRIIPILHAFRDIAREYETAILYLVGELATSIEREVQDFIYRNNLEERILITGYTTLEEFENYINATDICINLRHPYNGETSGSLMRIMAKGKCAIVNDIGSFSEIPNNCCVKIKPVESMSSQEEESTHIYSRIKELIDDPNKLFDIERNAKEFAVENLDIKEIAKQYKDYIISSSNNTITEKLLLDVADHIDKSGYEIDEAYKIASTLSFLKVFHNGRDS